MNDILAKSLLNKIERFETFEERLNVRLENVSVKIYENKSFSIYFEVHSTKGISLEESIKIQCVTYDAQGQILGLEYRHVLKETFFGFEVLEIYFRDQNILDEVTKLRLYPKL